MEYDVPSAAGGDAGLEGFAIESGSARLGRVAALNRTAHGLVVVVDTGDAYRTLSVEAVARIERLPRTVLLTAAGEAELAAAAPVDARIVRVESERLVRYVPFELERLAVDGVARPRECRSDARIAGGVLLFTGGVATFVGAPLTVVGVGGGALRWIWVAVPLAAVTVGVVLVWRTFDPADSARSRTQTLGDTLIAVLGISPRTRRRG